MKKTCPQRLAVFCLPIAISAVAWPGSALAHGFETRVFPSARNADREVKQACLRAIRDTYGTEITGSRARLMRPEGWPAWIRLEATLRDGRSCVCRGSYDYPSWGNSISGDCE